MDRAELLNVRGKGVDDEPVGRMFMTMEGSAVFRWAAITPAQRRSLRRWTGPGQHLRHRRVHPAPSQCPHQ